MADKENAKVESLKPSHEAFAQNYVANGGNGTKAAENAGFAAGEDGATAAVTASRLLRNAKVRERIKELESQSGVSTSEVVGTLASHMRGDITDALDDTDPAVIRLRASGVSHLIKKVKFDSKTGRMTEIEFHDSQAAARTLGKYKGLEQLPRENDGDYERRRNVLLALVERTHGEALEAGQSVTRSEVIDKLIQKRPDAAQYLVSEMIN